MDKLYTVNVPDLGSYSEVRNLISGTININLLLPGLGALPIDPDTGMSISLGGFGFSSYLADADASSANSATFYQYIDDYDANGSPITRRVGQITFSRSGDKLTITGITGSSTDLPSVGSIAAADWYMTEGPVDGVVDLLINVGDLDYSNSLIFYSGNGTLTHKTGGMDEFDLSTVTISGANDSTNPTLTISSPKAGQRWTNEVITITGTADDNVAVEGVMYQLNHGPWTSAEPTEGLDWAAEEILTPGTNVVRAFATDLSGNYSPTGKVSFVYVLTAPLTVNTNGHGKVTPDYNGKQLDIGKSYSMTAAPGTGYVFTNWTGSLTTNKPTLTFLMASNLSFTANFVDVQKPTLAISFPAANARVSNSVVTVRGSAKDNDRVANVWFQLNEGTWNPVTSGSTNWTADMTLTPGTNVVRAFAVDPTRNYSPTGKVSFVYALTAPLTVTTNGHGKVTPDYNGKSLEIGKSYSMTAAPGTGYVFTNWMGSQSTNKPMLTFLMASNLSFTANFVDVSKPTLAITSPLANARVSNELITVRGTAKDNDQIAAVWVQLNDGRWSPVTSGSTNWTADLTLAPGTNVVRAFAVDPTGNYSPTGRVSFFYVLTAPLAVTANGRGTFTPNYNGKQLELGRTYSMTATATSGSGYVFTNWTGSLTTNKSVLTFLMASNLSFTANFADVQKPTVAITFPSANARLSNDVITLRGTAKDNDQVASVWLQLNAGEWTTVTNGLTNWTADVFPTPGTNTARVYALDLTGNSSTTNSVKFIFTPATLTKTAAAFLAPPVIQMLVTGPTQPGGNDTQIGVTSSRDCTVVIETSVDLLHWQPLSTHQVPAGETIIITDPETAPAKFYRAVVP